ncbi:MAG TPA: SRPBCC family protein [Gemmatimonadaceae bacterium]|nr:SRPBCC family protein [Gemmatimonadaceae bacterium]
MRRFAITTDIAAPSDRVWAVMSDTDRWHEWTPSVTSVKRMDDAPFAVGTRVLIRQPMFPPALWKVTAIEPGRSFTWESVAPGFRAVGTHRVEPTPSGSRATLSLDYHGPLGGVFGRMTRAITERYIGYEADGLKARSENPAYRSGAPASR